MFARNVDAKQVYLVLRIRVEDFFYRESGDIPMNKKQLFQKLYDQTYINLRQFVQYRSRNPHMVDDILQEIYLETIPSYRSVVNS